MSSHAMYLLNNCDLIIRENCVIYGGCLYEKLTDTNEFRWIIDVDHYDYVTYPNVIEELNLEYEMRRAHMKLR